MGISVDHIPCLQAWSESLGGISYPLLSDFWPHGEVSELYGVLRTAEGHSERAIFIVDKRGYLRYVDVHDIDHQPDNDTLRKVLQGLEPPSVVKPAAGPTISFDEPLPRGGVVLYCARWCKDCKKARAWLEEHEVEFQEVDIDYNMAARAQIRQWANGAIVTPTIDFNGVVVLDYRPDKLEEALRTFKAAGN